MMKEVMESDANSIIRGIIKKSSHPLGSATPS